MHVTMSSRASRGTWAGGDGTVSPTRPGSGELLPQMPQRLLQQAISFFLVVRFLAANQFVGATEIVHERQEWNGMR